MLNDFLSALGIKTVGASESSKPVVLGRLGALGAVAAYLPGEVQQGWIENADGPVSVSQLIVRTAAWMVIYSIGYTLALTIGQNRYLHRPWLNPQEGLMAAVGGAIFGVISGGLAQAFFSAAATAGDGNPLMIEMARIMAWALFGALIGFGMSFVIPNLGRVHGTLGGGTGGAVGAIGFIACTALAGDATGRFIGMAIVGFALGYAIGLVEEASRTAWLQVSRGSSARETVRVSLGAEPVCVGGNSQRCAVWAPGARAIALRFRFVDGKVLCDDMATERQMVVDPGFQQQLGNVTVTVCVAGASPGGAGQSSVAVGPVATQPPPRPAPPPPAPGLPRLPTAAVQQGHVNKGRVPEPTGGVRVSPLPPATGSRKLPPPPPPPPKPGR